ncbi:medium-chain fatty acid-CoA ligase faa2 [Tieghemiomyces parasiticus]|uniref:Medium-chain fatty acid-CoA ligase faa2 n=1 Tax=Tieghemiomyces parasiticus TaxID=78921 RepID=A0A9W8DTI1_9FUNG|nr:medium-chain fatty acid-CoA ligase faa2 [Tieghemiomyces parasiticus]
MVAYSTVALGAVVAAVGYVYLRQPSDPDVHPAVLRQQSDVSFVRQPGESAVYRAKATPHGLPLLGETPAGLPPLRDWWHPTAALPDKAFLHMQVSGGAEPTFVNLPYATFRNRLHHVAAGLHATLGPTPRRVALMLAPSVEWLLAYYALLRLGHAVIPVSPDCPPADLVAALQAAQADTLVLPAQVPVAIHDVLTTATHLITVPLPPTEGEPVDLVSVGLPLHCTTWPETEADASTQPAGDDLPAPPMADQVAHIQLTMEGDGNWRAMAATHHQLTIITATVARSLFPARVALAPTDRYLAAAPFTDPVALALVHAISQSGGSVVVGTFPTAEAVSAAAYLSRPTVIRLAPSLYQGLYAALLDHIDRYATLEAQLCRASLRRKHALVAAGRLVTSSFYDLVYFRHFREALGGDVRVLVADGAAATRGAADFFRAVLACQVLLTRGVPATGSLTSATVWGDYAEPFGPHAGAPVPSLEVKLVRASEQSDDDEPAGELYIRGPGVFHPLATHVDPAAWCPTGQQARMLPNCTLQLVGKSVTLPSGATVDLDSVENVLRASPYVTQVAVYAPQTGGPLRAAVVPHHAALYAWAKRTTTRYALATVAQNPAVLAEILTDLKRVAAEFHLPAEAVPGSLVLSTTPFTTANGLLTPDETVDRTRIQTRFG